MKLPRLLLLTDRRQLPPDADLLDTVTTCVAAGLEAVVLRELDLLEDERAQLARRLAATGARIVSARSRLPGTVAVHLASHQPAGAAGGAAHGRSCHTEDEVRRAAAEGAAYVTVSPVATTPSKAGYGPAVGPSGVRRALAAADGVPVYALGGVTPANAGEWRAAGAHGVAVMGAVMRADDPAAECRALLEQVR